MKVLKKFSICILAVAFVFGLAMPVSVRAATNPNLGAASTFSVLASTLITGTPTSISGDVGNVNAIGGSSITGVTGAVVSGTIYAQDLVAPSEAVIAAAVQADASTAYTTTAGLAPEGTPIAVSELGGITRGPGVYDIPGNAILSSGVLTLDGPGTYIFRTGPASNLTSSALGSINFINGARPCDLFWNIGTAAEIGGTSFSGTILASTGIHFTNAGVALNGRALAVGADVTLNVDGSISGPTCPAPVTTATLTLVKTIVNDNGGTRTVTDFPLTATGPTTITGVSGTAGVTSQVVNTGTYTLSEGTQTDYTAGTWSCTNGIIVNGSNQITLASGNTTTCSITNTFIPATLTLTKTVINIGGGTKTTTDFQAKIDGVDVPWITPQTLSAGLHTASEVILSNYTASVWGGDCAADGTVTLVPGVNACTITNTYVPPATSGSGGGSYTPPVPPLIDVVKVPSPLALPSGPGSVTYTYTLHNIGTVPVTNITMADDSCGPLSFISGDINGDSKLDTIETWIYTCKTNLTKTTINIVTATGWANGISATDIASATVVVSASIVPPLIHITKVPSPLALLTGAGTVTYKYTVTNPGTVPLSNVSIVDDKCTGLPGRVVGHPGDLNKNNLLESNESWSFTCKSKLTKTTTNTATASGEANGLTAKDFAIATVVVTNVPGLPKTGFGPENNILNNTSWKVILPVGILGILISFYLARKKQTN